MTDGLQAAALRRRAREVARDACAPSTAAAGRLRAGHLAVGHAGDPPAAARRHAKSQFLASPVYLRYLLGHAAACISRLEGRPRRGAGAAVVRRSAAVPRSRAPQAQTVFPAEADVFSALRSTPLDDVRRAHPRAGSLSGDGQAHGLSFSVRPDIATPASLVNIFKELEDDVGAHAAEPRTPRVVGEAGRAAAERRADRARARPNSHKGKGWEPFTDGSSARSTHKPAPVVFVLWGAFAQKKKALVDTARHVVVEGAHPSPLSARAGILRQPAVLKDQCRAARGRPSRRSTGRCLTS